MVNFLVGVARIFLLLQVCLAMLALAAAGVSVFASPTATIWQGLLLVLAAFGLLALAGFTAVLFQISDRLAAILKVLQHGSFITAPTSNKLGSQTVSSARREPPLRNAVE